MNVKRLVSSKWKNRQNPAPRAKPTLSVAADEKFPSMVNVLEIRYNDEFGKHMVASADIAVGQTIVLDDVFCVGVYSDDRAYCSTCLAFIENFIPCPHCTYVMFCDATISLT